jgi:hypothetical protein
MRYWLKRIAMVVSCAFVVFKNNAATIIAICALILTTWQIWTIRDNAQRQMRAYVFLAILPAFEYPREKPDRLGLGFEIKNSGLTWARNLTIRKATIPRDLTSDYDPWARAKWDPADLPMVLGPNQSLKLQLGEIWRRDVPAIIEGKLGYDFAIWVTYRDTVSRWPVVHRTQMVQRFAADKDGGTSFSYVGAHNCADDDCPEK